MNIPNPNRGWLYILDMFWHRWWCTCRPIT